MVILVSANAIPAHCRLNISTGLKNFRMGLLPSLLFHNQYRFRIGVVCWGFAAHAVGLHMQSHVVLPGSRAPVSVTWLQYCPGGISPVVNSTS